ncbi:MAG: peptide deformylase [Acidobacteriia bacterium]|nr:peptide deformylase [Terriglobia bacterium]
MPSREILQLGTPLLWEKSKPAKKVRDQRIGGIIRDLDDTLAKFRQSTGWGRGISAPQIGELVRISFVRMDDALAQESRLLEEARGALPTREPLVLINPEITFRSTETFTLWDDCFSFPDLLVKVSRHVAIEVSYQNTAGQPRHLRALKGLSELLQHEIDHLDGVLAIDRRIDDHSLATRQACDQLQLR